MRRQGSPGLRLVLVAALAAIGAAGAPAAATAAAPTAAAATTDTATPSRTATTGTATPASTPARAAVTSRHILYGALVGGPSSANDAYTDDRTNYQINEVALDYNAGLTGALARLVAEFGGAPLADFPPRETPDGPQILAQAAVNGSTFTEIKAYLINKSAWPARHLTGARLRYFFTLDGATTPGQLSVSSPYNQCDAAAAPRQFNGAVYYVEITCSADIAPAGQSAYRKEVQFQITSSCSWDPANDWSYQGLPGGGAAPVATDRVVLLQADQILWGTPPGSAVPDTVPPSVPTGLAALPGGTSVRLTWAASTDNVGVSGYDVLRVTNTGGTAVALATVTARYWFTGEAANPSYQVFCDPQLPRHEYLHGPGQGDRLPGRLARLGPRTLTGP